jgi:DNA-binding transcriptional LysR family regulator
MRPADVEAPVVGHVGFLPSAAARLVPAIVRAHRAAFPAVGLHLSELLDQPQLEALTLRRLHLALPRTVWADPTLVFEPLIREPMSVAVAHDHRLARRGTVTHADLEGEPFVLWPRATAPETVDDVIRACRAAGFSPPGGAGGHLCLHHPRAGCRRCGRLRAGKLVCGPQR